MRRSTFGQWSQNLAGWNSGLNFKNFPGDSVGSLACKAVLSLKPTHGQVSVCFKNCSVSTLCRAPDLEQMPDMYFCLFHQLSSFTPFILRVVTWSFNNIFSQLLSYLSFHSWSFFLLSFFAFLFPSTLTTPPRMLSPELHWPLEHLFFLTLGYLTQCWWLLLFRTFMLPPLRGHHWTGFLLGSPSLFLLPLLALWMLPFLDFNFF